MTDPKDPQDPSDLSLTNKYLREVLDNEMLQKLAVALGFKMEISRNADLLHDHIDKAVERWLDRDAFAGKIELGEAPKFGALKAFLINSAYTDARKLGRDPVCRTLLGAKTQTDFKLEKEGRSTADFQHPAPSEISVEKNIDGEITNTTVIDNSPSFNEADFQEVWDRLETIFEKKFGDHGEEYLHIMHDFGVEGYTVKEIAERRSISDSDVTQILSEVRRHMRRDRDRTEIQDLLLHLS